MDEEDDLVEISAAELAPLRGAGQPRLLLEVPAARGWSSATFACHRNISSCMLACCCPCAQFGLNQRAAFRASCFKWSLLWLAPIVLLYFVIDRAFPDYSMDRARLDRDTAFLYAAPLSMVCMGLVGMVRRRQLRLKYGIGGSVVGDFVCHCCCTCCSLAKEAREIRRQALEEAVNSAEQDLKGVVEEV